MRPVRQIRRDGDRDGDKSRKLYRLGVAEFIPRSGHGDALTWARWIFLQTVAKRYPEVLVDLHTRATDQSEKSRNNTPEAFVQYWGLPSWTLAYVSATWEFSANHPERTPNYWVDRNDVAGKLVVDDVERPVAPEYNPTSETKAAYLARVNQYIADVEARVDTEGFVERMRKDPRHFEWLVDNFIGKKSYADLWKSSDVKSRNAPREACIDLDRFLSGLKHAQK